MSVLSIRWDELRTGGAEAIIAGLPEPEPDVIQRRTAEQIASDLPGLSDVETFQTVRMAQAYEYVRTSVLGLAGLLLLAELNQPTMDSASGVTVVLMTDLHTAREANASALMSQRNAIRSRARAIDAAIDELEQTLPALRQGRIDLVSRSSLEKVVDLLRISALYEANMIMVGSASCTETFGNEHDGNVFSIRA